MLKYKLFLFFFAFFWSSWLFGYQFDDFSGDGPAPPPQVEIDLFVILFFVVGLFIAFFKVLKIKDRYIHDKPTKWY